MASLTRPRRPPQTDSVSVTVADLLASPLGLVAVSSWCADSERPINWVSTTELEDPSQFLRPGDLVLTTGLGNRTAHQRSRFVECLTSVPVAALGYGVGLIDDETPRHLVDLAEEHGLALFEVPVTSPFTAVSHWIAEELYTQRYKAVQRATEIQGELTRVLLCEFGLEPMLLRLSQLTGAECAVVDRRGELLAAQPPKSEWEPLVELRRQPADDESAVTVTPIVIEQLEVAYLCMRHSEPETPVTPFVAGLIGLELARRQAILTGRRELLGQVLDDIVHGVITGPEVARKLRTHGIDPGVAIRVLVGRVDADAQKLRRVPWSISDLFATQGDQIQTALVDDCVVVLAPLERDVTPLAEELRRQLGDLGQNAAVGISQPHTGTRAIRIGFHEARNAVRRAPGVHRAEGLSIASLLLSSTETPVKDVARATLQPLLDYDKERDGALIKTLRVYFDHGCSPHLAAAELVIHRNGLQYRLQKIEALTGHDLTSFHDQVRLWMALAALDLT
jgi:PucR family transcriptional regulator, purine catabolism regulatory protein